MNSYEFMQTITTNISYIRTMFDTTMALYNVVGQFDGIQVVNTETINAALIRYIITGDPVLMNQMVSEITGSYVTIYGHTYIVTITKETSDTAIICLEDTNPEEE